MAESSISFLLDQLSVLLKEEKKLLGGLGREVDFIRGDVEQMRAFLRVADSNEETDPQLKVWVRQLREIGYAIEDVLDRYMLRFYHRDAHGFRGCLKKSYASVKNLKARHEIASEIKTIKSKLENASKSHKTFEEKYSITPLGSSSNHSTTTSYDDGRGDALLLEDIDVVGIEEPKQQLLEWLSSVESGLEVISVVGMAGLGKTTLIKKVYEASSVNSTPLPYGVKLEEGSAEDAIFRRIMTRRVLPTKFVDLGVVTQLGVGNEVSNYTNVVGLAAFLSFPKYSYQRLVYEFISTLKIIPLPDLDTNS